MNKKKILIVSRSFYPQNSPRSFRTTELAKEFARQGHDVTVLTPKNTKVHSDFEKEHGLKIKNLGCLKWRKINIEGKGIIRKIKRGLRRGLQLLFDYPNIELMFKVRKALNNEKGYDLLISIAVPYPVHWGVAWARKKAHPIAKTWVADCGDPYMGAKTDSFKKLFYFKYVEKWFSRKADYISITNAGFKHNYYPEFHHKIVEITQGFRFDQVRLAENRESNDIPQFGFAGILIQGTRDPKKLLQHLCSVKKDFKFILYTKTPHLVEPHIKSIKEKFEFRDYIPRDELLYELSKMDFLVNFEYDPKVQVPSKLIDYALTRRPVLNINSSNFQPKIINEFLEGNYQNQFILPDMEKYKIENVARNFLALVIKS